jgi:PAS domain S-box-containing protein
MSPVQKQLPILDLNTLDQLPVAIALFDNEKIYFLNRKATELFRIPKTQEKKITDISIFRFLEEDSHKTVRSNNTKILKGQKFPSTELCSKDYKGKALYLEINYNLSALNGKKVIQATFTEISERKKTEELLNEVKQKFELITNNTNDIISFYTYFPQEKYLYVSPNITRILGFKPEEVLKDKNFFNKRVSDNKRAFLQIDRNMKVSQRKNVFNNNTYLFKTKKKSGDDVWLENSLIPIGDPAGKIRFYLNVLRDITEHKQKEIELQQQKIDYQPLLDNSQVAYAIHHNGTIVFSNQELIKLLKLKDKKDILGKFAADFFSLPDRKRAVKRIKEIYQRKKINEPYNYKLLDSKGNQIEVEIKSTLIKYNNQLSILSSIHNISQRRQLEREMLRAEISEQNNKLLQKEIKEKQRVEKTLIEKTGQLSSILESSSHLIWTVNKSNVILSFNKNFHDTLLEKYGVKIFIGCRIDELLARGREEYTEFWYTKYKEAFDGKKLEFERQEEKDQQRIYRKIFINPIYNSHG